MEEKTVESESYEEIKECPVEKSLEVSKDGKIVRKKDGTILEQIEENNHYYVEFPKNNKLWVHRLVAFTWPNGEKGDKDDIVHHINGDGLDNRYDNLRWTDGRTHALIHM